MIRETETVFKEIELSSKHFAMLFGLEDWKLNHLDYSRSDRLTDEKFLITFSKELGE